MAPLSERQDDALRARRWALFRAAVLTIVVIFGAAIAFGAFKGDDPVHDASVGPGGIRGAKETRAMLRGVPQHGVLLGRPDAPATITEFADVKCSACQQQFVKVLPRVVKDLVRTGRANVELRLIALPSFRPDNLVGRAAVNALALRDRGWNLAEMLYYNQGVEGSRWVTPRRLREIAAETPGVGRTLPIPTRPSAKAAALADEADALAKRLGVTATPTSFVRPRGAALAKAQRVSVSRLDDPYDKLASAVSDAAKGH